jgi:MFS family permease
VNSRGLLSTWIVVSGLAVISFVVGGSGSVALGQVIRPVMVEFGWSNGQTSGIATAFSFSLLVAAPGVGIVVDKLGARPVIGFGTLAAAGGFFLASRAHSYDEMLLAFVIVGVGYSAAFYVPSAIVATDWMKSRKSLGMGIVWGAVSVGAAAFSIWTAQWIELYGWRAANAIIAALSASMFPLALATIRTASPHDAEGSVPRLNRGSLRPPRQEMLSAVFLVATSGGALFALGMNGIYYHVVSVLLTSGYSMRTAGFVFGVSWVLSALGSLLLGWAADKAGVKRVLAGALLLCAFGTLCLLGAADVNAGIAYVVIFVVCWGGAANSAFQLIPVIFAEQFGTGNLGALIGVQSAIAGIIGAAAPITTGLLYDRFGDYRVAIAVSASVLAVAFFVVLLIKVPRRLARTA